jgi:diacylglycerol kinase family enzyme
MRSSTRTQGADRVIDLFDVDLGYGERTVSAVMCGSGWDAAMMAASEAMKRRLGWGAYAITGARQVRRRPMRLQISVDGSPVQELSGRTVLIANVGSLVAGLNLVPEADSDDGVLGVLVIDSASPVDWVRTGAGLVRAKGSDGDPARPPLPEAGGDRQDGPQPQASGRR